jgi:hypothetical protein
MKRKLLIFSMITLLAGSCQLYPEVDGVYRYYWGKKNGFDVWIVDGNVVRQKIYNYFLYGGNEQRYPFNPKGEIWIDHAVSCEEFEMTMAHEMNERHLMAKFGWTYQKAHDSSLALEVVMRKRYREICLIHEASLHKVAVTDHNNEKEIKNIPDSIQLQAIYRVPLGQRDGISVWIVDGYKVRAEIFPDFGFSGNDLACHFIPSKEIWIDGQASPEETEYSITSELIQRRMILNGASFDSAYGAGVDTVTKRRIENEKLVAAKPAILLPDSLTRYSGTIDPKEK